MTLPRPVAAVVFDMDGLLVDTEAVYREAMILAARDMGRQMPDALMLSMIGGTWVRSAQLIRAEFGADFDTDRFRQGAFACFYELARVELKLKAGVLELLDHLDEKRLPRAIATSSRRSAVDHHIGMHGLLDRFQAIVAQGDYIHGKPHPEPYLTAAARLGVAPEHCLALEDSHTGVRAAAAAGMMTIMVPDLLHPTDEMETLCVRIARDLHEVHALLRGAE